ncbi:MAG: hypothetical protein IJX47_03030 [Clostridia bacterium]|nr:hypothetical protein [Clostridia bacterium]
MVLWRNKWCGLAAVLVSLLVLLVCMGGAPVSAEESHSHASSIPNCPKCGAAWTPIVYAPTCTSTGFTTYLCQECSYVELVEHAEKLPHSWKQIASTDPTCTDAGSVTNRCSVCGTTEKVEQGQALGHSYQVDVIEPTCSSIGYTLHTCTRCGDSFQTDQVGTASHTYSQTVITEPTCHSVGHLRNVCLVCGQYTTEEIPMVEHNWKTEVIAASHTAQGYTVYTCQYEGCGTVKRGDFTDLLPYDMVWNEVTAPSCTSSGVKIGYCSDGCGHTETVVLPHLGHDFGEWETVYQATEDSDGLERHICSRCQHTETRTVEYDPQADKAQREPINPLLLGVIGFLLLVAVAVIVLCFLLLMEHARRDKFKRKQKSII